MNVLSKHFCCFCLLVFVFFSPRLQAQVANPEWIRTANNKISGGDRGDALVRDGAGNLIVYGTLNHTYPFSKPTLLLRKFAPNQTLLWEARFRSSLPYDRGFNPEKAVDVEVDDNGNIYTLSNAMVSNNMEPDILLRKYDPNGALLWSRDYDHIGKIDEGSELHVSGNGIATVLGRSQDQNDAQLIVLRYASNGNLIFQYRRPDPGLFQIPQDMIVTDDGRTLIAGGNGPNLATSYQDFTLTLIDSTGGLVWDLPAGSNPSTAGTPFVYEIAMDSAGDIYTMNKASTFGGDFILIYKFDPSGNLLDSHTSPMTASFSTEPKGMVIDPQGQVYYSFFFQDPLIGDLSRMIKLDPNLDLVWDIGLDSALAISFPQRRSLKMAPNGNLVTIGQTNTNQANANMLYLEYTPAGTKVKDLVWAGPGNGFDGPMEFQLEGNGIAWVTGIASSTPRNQDLLALRLDTDNGNHWSDLRDNPVNGRDEVTALTVSQNGAVWLGGRSEGANTLTGMFINQYDPSGTLTWDTLVSFPDQHLYLGDLVTDANNNVYALARSADYLYLYKFSPQGILLWRDDIPKGNALFFSGESSELTLAPDGTLYLANNLTKNGFQTTWFLASYSPNGTQNWTWESPLMNPNHAKVNAIYPYNGGIAAGGELNRLPAMRVLDSNGNLVNAVDHPQIAIYDVKFALEPNGNAIFGGDLSINGVGTASLLKYDQAGNLLFQQDLNITGRDNIDIYDLALDGNGAIYIGGRCNAVAFTFASYCAKFSPNGNFIWDDLSSYSGGAQDVGIEAVLPAPGGSMFMAGRFAQTPHKAQTGRYDPAGILSWDYRYPNGDYPESEGLLLANGPGGELYMAGNAIGDTLAGDFLLVKFSQITDLEPPLQRQAFILHPNPARDWLRVNRSATDAAATLEILDLQGRVLLRQSAAARQEQIELSTAGLSQGFYFLRLLEAGAEAQVRKFQVR